MLPLAAVSGINGGVRSATSSGDWAAANGAEGLFLLERDLLDQQVIDINGRKVVRVNDVDLVVDTPKAAGPNEPTRAVLRVISVDVGARGAVRRLLRGVAPRAALHTLLGRIPPRRASTFFSAVSVMSVALAPFFLARDKVTASRIS